MPEISLPAELPSEDMMRKTGSLTGNSLKSYDYISTINTSYKKKYKMERVDNSGKKKFIDEDGVDQGIYGGINFLFNL